MRGVNESGWEEGFPALAVADTGVFVGHLSTLHSLREKANIVVGLESPRAPGRNGTRNIKKFCAGKTLAR